ncbi:hypothetical protein NHX12_023933 [Muraenolepis orangiensis]|uniref:Uncharacterized protein n=1 Tax=Muraenolepis orangiensis TaxID=630683 RepID=A0A9Q0EKJ3_9TELE|nr:hypothetical protein NHX12_023933 [Muraenolepis orangiensis]
MGVFSVSDRRPQGPLRWHQRLGSVERQRDGPPGPQPPRDPNPPPGTPTTPGPRPPRDPLEGRWDRASGGQRAPPTVKPEEEHAKQKLHSAA